MRNLATNSGCRKAFNWFVLIWCATILILALFPQIFRKGPSLYEKMEQVIVCSGPDASTGTPTEEVRVISKAALATQDLYACGNLITDGQYTDLFVSVRESNQPPDSPSLFFKREKFYPGYVYIPIEIPAPSVTTYKIKVGSGRMTLAQTEIQVINP